MKIDIITLFPNMFTGFLSESIVKRAIDANLVEINIINLRDYSPFKHSHVDDTPYGGGAGMVLRCEPMDLCLKSVKSEISKTILMSPQGVPYNQNLAIDLANEEHIILVCGHYEGFDERIRKMVDMEISIGDYVLTGGEIPSMAIADSIIRLIDGVIEKESHETDSFRNGLLEYPQYTKPAIFNGMEVPEVLQNGNHKLIKKWRLKESLRKTYLRRPDLLEKIELTEEEKELLEEIKEEEKIDA